MYVHKKESSHIDVGSQMKKAFCRKMALAKKRYTIAFTTRFHRKGWMLCLVGLDYRDKVGYFIMYYILVCHKVIYEQHWLEIFVLHLVIKEGKV